MITWHLVQYEWSYFPYRSGPLIAGPSFKGWPSRHVGTSWEKIIITQNYQRITILDSILSKSASSGSASRAIHAARKVKTEFLFQKLPLLCCLPQDCLPLWSANSMVLFLTLFSLFFFFFSLTLLSCWHFCTLRVHHPRPLFQLSFPLASLFSSSIFPSSFPPLSFILLIIHTFALPRSHLPIDAEYIIPVTRATYDHYSQCHSHIHIESFAAFWLISLMLNVVGVMGVVSVVGVVAVVRNWGPQLESCCRQAAAE